MDDYNFEDFPFGPADHHDIEVKTHDGGVYLVTWEAAYRLEPENAQQLGMEIVRKAGQAKS